MARHNLRNSPHKERRSLRSLVISVASALFPTLTLLRKDNGVGAPQLQFYKNSVSPSTSDDPGTVLFDINDSDITRENIAEFAPFASNITAGAEESAWQFYNNRSATFLFGGNGLYWSGSDGQSPPGANGEMNCAQYWLNGERFPMSVVFTSAQQTLTNGALVTVAHGLGVVPRMTTLRLECTTAEANWGIGEGFEMNANGNGVMAMYSDATNVYVRYYSVMSGSITANNKTTGASFIPTLANWRLVIKAYL